MDRLSVPDIPPRAPRVERRKQKERDAGRLLGLDLLEILHTL